MGWKVGGVINFSPNLASLFLRLGSRGWYVKGAYVPLHDTTSVHRIDQSLEVAPKVMKVILLGYLNVRLR